MSTPTDEGEGTLAPVVPLTERAGTDLPGGFRAIRARRRREAERTARVPEPGEVAHVAGEVRVAVGSGSLVFGSHPSCDVVLPGLHARHAVLGRDGAGRLVLSALSGSTRVDGVPVLNQVVDEAARVVMAGHRIALLLPRPAPRLV
ncbi:FHA domain-containing protein [Nocardioides bruguierae]|uniref:FHA domain-containing protein n=1 Tax=Nocardioides bruguierae TaxID=2945102 RepID=UPI00202148DD|nr:FHA domain-containing protein [Nocardioides bruguierae]MCL8024836.1 FHA domain-containing protein [Nocardioides bruguierae]